MDNKILLRAALKKFVLGIGILGLFLFIFAGDIRYWNAWLFIAAFAVCIFIFGVYLYTTDKDLLQKRLNSKEKEKEQNIYNLTAGISFIAIFIVCGFDYRLGWSLVSIAVVVSALFGMLCGYALFIVTLMQNRFASRTVEIQDKQKVIDTGVYSMVRHPMYSAAIIMMFAVPVVLGSYFALIPVLGFLAGIIFRIMNEEKVLSDRLEGYTEYMKKTRYRLIPYIW